MEIQKKRTTVEQEIIAEPLIGDRVEEVEERIVRNDLLLDDELSLGSPVERHEQVRVVRDGDLERREVISEDIGLERRFRFLKAMNLYWLAALTLIGLLALRVLLKLIAANPNSPFAAAIYGLSDLFVWPFFGLTASPAAGAMVIDVPTLIAIVFYALFFLLVGKLTQILVSRANTRSVEVYQRRRV